MRLPKELIEPFFCDEDFRSRLLEDPEAAARTMGVQLDANTLDGLRNLNPAIVGKLMEAATFRMASC
jgi:hypothetical protein